MIEKTGVVGRVNRKYTNVRARIGNLKLNYEVEKSELGDVESGGWLGYIKIS